MATYNDTAMPVGSRVLTINSVTYVVEQFELTYPVSVDITRSSEVGVPTDQWLTNGTQTGTATLQLDATTTAVPTQFQEFSTPNHAGSSTTYFIVTVGKPEGNTIDQKVSITFRQKLNP